MKHGATQLDHHVAQLLRRQTAPELEARWALIFALLDKALELARKQESWLAIGLIPLAIQVDDTQFSSFLEAHHLAPTDVDREAPQRRIQDWGKMRGVEVIDLLSAFRSHGARKDEPLYLPHDGHWTELGHRVAAEEIAKELTRRRFLTGTRLHPEHH